MIRGERRAVMFWTCAAILMAAAAVLGLVRWMMGEWG